MRLRLKRLEGRTLVGSDDTQRQRLAHLTVLQQKDLLLGMCLKREQQERGQGQQQWALLQLRRKHEGQMAM